MLILLKLKTKLGTIKIACALKQLLEQNFANVKKYALKYSSSKETVLNPRFKLQTVKFLLNLSSYKNCNRN